MVVAGTIISGTKNMPTPTATAAAATPVISNKCLTWLLGPSNVGCYFIKSKGMAGPCLLS